jgi:hypothetical protein
MSDKSRPLCRVHGERFPGCPLDIIDRRRAVSSLAVRPAVPAAPDRSKLDVLVARARASPVVAAPNRPRAQTVFLNMTCSATGKPFIGIAERTGDALRLVGAQLPQPGSGSETRGELLSGSYSDLDTARDWFCPVCRAHESRCVIWVCGCPAHDGAVHCGSKGNRASYCACGRYEARTLAQVRAVPVRGTAAGVVSRKPEAGGARPGSRAPSPLMIESRLKEK